jgi:hypothetical protein
VASDENIGLLVREIDKTLADRKSDIRQVSEFLKPYLKRDSSLRESKADSISTAPASVKSKR